MGNYKKFYSAINQIETLLRKDLIGPIEDDEIIEKEEPLTYYCMGILWSKRLNSKNLNSCNNGFEDEYDLENEIVIKNDSITSTNMYKPSAMAISTMLSKQINKISVVFNFAKYKFVGEKLTNRIINKYKRIPYEIKLDFNIPNKCGLISNNNNTLKELQINIQCHIRKIFADGSKLITISVVNEKEAAIENIPRNESALFQCKLDIYNEKGFIPIYDNKSINQNEETLINDMLYRNIYNYAYGHGCSIKYKKDNGIVKKISSEFMPCQKVLQMMPNELKNDDFLKMEYLYKTPKSIVINNLNSFIDNYEIWFNKIRNVGSELERYKRAVEKSLENIQICIERLRSGINILVLNNNAWDAFIYMNQAMLLQRVKSKNCDSSNVKWYPFQLAYILQIIPDIVDSNSKFRDYVDLLWFPTGGGKTEAYLGVSAFVIFYRRLLNKPLNDGVTIIMRYTLRLLTIQQFERATALICACEHIRRLYNIDGGEISIGLWIGSNMTPNHLSEAAEKIKELKDNPNKKIYEGNPVQITKCPWCGEVIDIGCYSVGKNLDIRCNNKECEFNTRLPIYIVDDDIYEKTPTLILSTIDKFARIVWEEKSKEIFGGNKILPPELIIQDELHLISGPLGSITGIYEVAIDKLCENNKRKVKIIASTATVKNAKEQIKNLYNREMFQFPPNGIDESDSFFAVLADESKKAARTYIGLCETGGSIADLMIRIYANLIFSKNLFIKQGVDNEVIDQFYTTVGYFNAIKDLGASASIINDRVSTNIKSLISNKFKEISMKNGLTIKDIKNYEKHDELTSRKTSKEIKETLEQLSKPFTNDLCYSYVLASNMLSVGIDIDRLGIMTVDNQPKSNSEYIQATSRVGRSNPGIVFALYNNSRSRDKSHYEQFPYYHSTFYQYVEATSVTPFSARAIEKALHCIFIALVRHTIDGMNDNKSAVKFRNELAGVQEIKEYILKRVSDINSSAIELAKEWLDYFADRWEELAKENKDTLLYTDFNGGVSLLNSAEKNTEIGLPTILNALRNVDEASNIYILRREEK